MTDSEFPFRSVVDDTLAIRFLLTSVSQERQKAHAIFTRIRGDSLTGNLSNGRQPIGQGYEFAAPLIRFDKAGPANHQRHAMSAFQNVCLHSATLAHAVVFEFLNAFVDARGRPVIRCENDHRFLRQIQTIQSLEHVSDVMVHFEDEIPVQACTRFAYKSFVRNDRVMRTGWVPIDEKRLIGVYSEFWIFAFTGIDLQIFDHLVGTIRQPCIRIGWSERWINRTAILELALYITILFIQIGDTPGIVESHQLRSHEALIVEIVGIQITRFPARQDRFGIIMTQSPFPELPGIVILLFKQRGHRHSPAFEKLIPKFRSVARASFSSSPGITPRQQSITTRTANGCRCVSIGKRDPFASQAIDIRGQNLRFRIREAHIAITQIIQVDEENVRRLLCSSGPGKKYEQKNLSFHSEYIPFPNQQVHRYFAFE